MGKALKQYAIPREKVVIMTKCLWGVSEELTIILPHLVLMVHKLMMFIENIYWSNREPFEKCRLSKPVRTVSYCNL